MTTATGTRPRTAATYGVVVFALVLASAGALLVGRGDLSDESLRSTLLEIRAGRLAAAFLAGAALAVGGVIVQGLFRNPLASPSILGTTAGASLGGQSALLLHQWLLSSGLLVATAPEMVLPVGCLLGALMSLSILLVFVRRDSDLLVLLLTGFILSSLFLSLGGFLTSLAQRSYELGRAVVAFSLGGVHGVGLKHVALALPLVVTGVIAAWLWGRPLDVMLSGEDEAKSLGVDVLAVRRWTVVWVAVLTAAAVAIGGNVGFVGLVVPHALRPFVGVEHRRLVPIAALTGGTFLVACDVIAKAMPSSTEVPLGVVTGMVGAPIFLWLLVRSRREAALG